MRRTFLVLILPLIIQWTSFEVSAGPYAPAAGKTGSTAIFMHDPAFVTWATGWENYIVGTEVDLTWQTPQLALGKAAGTSFDVVSLGRGGQITLTFESGIGNGPGWDFAIFENGFSDSFLELGYVEVSSDGVNFFRFQNDSLTASPVGGFGGMDPTNINGYASKYRQGWGTPFDLSELVGVSPLLDVKHVKYVKIVDIVGNGSRLDSSGDVIYDPFPTVGTAGVDLDAIGVINMACNNDFPPDQPILLLPTDGQTGVSLEQKFQTSDFQDDDPQACEFHQSTHWQISTDPAFAESDLVADIDSELYLSSLSLQGSILEKKKTYYWRVKYRDSGNLESGWSLTFSFETTDTSNDSTGNGIPDIQELDPLSTVDLNGDNIPDATQISDQYKALNTVVGSGQMGIETSPNVAIEYVESVDPSSLPALSGGSKPEVFLLGMLNFRVRVPTAGDPVDIVIYLSKPASGNYRWFKFHPSLGWYAFSNAEAAFGADGRSLVLSLRDGGPHDADGAENGVIVDPGGVGALSQSELSPPTSGQAGLDGGCFISAASFGLTKKP